MYQNIFLVRVYNIFAHYCFKLYGLESLDVMDEYHVHNV
jgi:hypothetical protein